jgi:hypothetical protein
MLDGDAEYPQRSLDISQRGCDELYGDGLSRIVFEFVAAAGNVDASSASGLRSGSFPKRCPPSRIGPCGTAVGRYDDPGVSDGRKYSAGYMAAARAAGDGERHVRSTAPHPQPERLF